MTKHRRIIQVCAAAGLGLACSAALQAQQAPGQYTATLISGPSSTASAINSLSAAVGSTTQVDGSIHAALWVPGFSFDLGTLGGRNSAALAINAIGDAAGWSETPSGARHAFMLVGSSLGMVDLGTLGGLTSTATGINSKKQVVGFSTTSSGAVHAFLWDGQMTDLGVLGGSNSAANGINENTTVVGVSDVSDCTIVGCTNTRHAFTWSNGVMTDLGTLGASQNGESSEALAVAGNPALADAAFGYAQVQGVRHAVFWQSGTPSADLGSLDMGGATILSAMGGIYGQSTLADGTRRATWWNHNVIAGSFTATDLNGLISSSSPLRPALQSAFGADESGWVLVSDSASVYVLAPIVFDRPSLSFGTVPMSTTSIPQTVHITNNSQEAYNFSGVTLGDFQYVEDDCHGILDPNQTCSIAVAMAPATAGPLTGAVLLHSSIEFTLSLPLSGLGGITATLAPSANTIVEGMPVTLTWSSLGVSACTASGGGPNDGWTGSLGPSGTRSVSESSRGTYSYTLACSGNGQSTTAQTNVMVTAAAAGNSGGGGGGGEFGIVELAFLLLAAGAQNRKFSRSESEPRRLAEAFDSATSGEGGLQSVTA
jgi:probable HAF family extracellular repeat protein